MNSAEKTVMAYIKQATIELAGDVSFDSHDEFEEWVTNNFEIIIKKAKQLQAATVEKFLDSDNSASSAVKEVIAVRVYGKIHRARIQTLERARIHKILHFE